MKILDRKEFFNKISISAIGAFILSFFPIRIFDYSKEKMLRKVKVKIHPESIKRNN